MQDQPNLEPLQEVATVAAGNAATALSKLLGEEVGVAVPSVKLVPVEDITAQVGDVSHLTSSVLVRIKGDLQGLFLFSLEPHEAEQVAKGIAKQQAGDIKVEDETVLREMVNIISGAALNAVAKLLSLDLLQSVPASTTDMTGAVLDPFIAEFGSEFASVLTLQETFTAPASSVSLKFLAIIDPPSTDLMLEKIKQALDSSHAADR